jgi:hypothetical protein
MKYIITIILFFSGGILYLNLVIAQNEEKKHQRFIISQEEKSFKTESLTANLLQAEKDLKPEEITNAKDVVVETISKTKTEKKIASILKDLETEKKQPQVKKEKPTITRENKAPQIIKTLPNKEINTWQSGKDIFLEFDQEIDLESFYKNLKFSPSKDNQFSGEINYGETKKQIILKPIPALDKDVSYTLTLQKEVQSFNKKNTTTKNIIIKFLVK